MLKKNIFIFDFDSTVVSIETLDELINHILAKHGQDDLHKEIQNITDQGMAGDINLEHSIKNRLKISTINKSDILAFQNDVIKYITPGITKLIKYLTINHQEVFIVSGAFIKLIIPAAQKLNINAQHCYGNEFVYNQAGDVVGIDEKNPLIYNDGKTKVAEKIKEQIGNYNKVYIIGDGISDLKPYQDKVADHFLGFGINKTREKVIEQAPIFFYNIKKLTNYIKQSIQ